MNEQKPIITEATLQELVDEIYSRVEWGVMCIDMPTNEGQFLSLMWGGYISKTGAVEALRQELDAYNRKVIYSDNYRFREQEDE